MSEHLSKIEVDGYVRGTLSANKLLHIDDHLINCVECQIAITAGSPVDRAELFAALHHPDHDPHLSFDQTAAYVDHILDSVDREIVDHHLYECDPCREQVRDLESLRADLTAETVPPINVTTSPMGFWDRVRQLRFPSFALPAAAVLLITVLFAGWYFGIRKTETETALDTPPESSVQIGLPPTVSETAAEPGVESNTADKPKTLVGLNDGDGRLELDAAGKVSGLGDPRYEPLVAGVLAGKGVEISADLRQLRQSPGEIMGEGQTGVPFALSGPVGMIVETTQPKLRWRSLKGADTYRVDVFDEGFIKVASSPAVKTTEWKLGVPLRRGTVYRWQVTAIVDGAEVKSPVRPAPDARFKVLDAAAANRIAAARAKHGRSHLLLGTLYAEAGLLADAEREFTLLLQKNPDSAITRRLLEKVRSAR